MSIFDTIFGNKNQQQQQPQQQQPQGQQQQQPTGQQPNPHLQGNPTLPQNSGTPPQQPTPTNPNPESPTDKYANLWDTPTQQQQRQAPNFKLSNEGLQQVASGLNFTQGLKEADLQQLVQGGEGAVAALQNILSDFGKNVFAQSAHFSSHLTENGYNAAQQEIKSGLPSAVRDHMATSRMYESNERLRNPALQPLVGALQQQFAAKFPNATPTELNNMVTDYMSTTVAGAFAPVEDPAKSAKATNAPDFSSFLN